MRVGIGSGAACGAALITVIPSPLSAKQCRLFKFVSRNYDLDEPDESFRAFSEILMDQDRQMVEKQRPEELPLDLSADPLDHLLTRSATGTTGALQPPGLPLDPAGVVKC